MPRFSNDASTRRQILAGGGLGIAVATARAGAQPAKSITPAKAIHQEEEFKCAARRIYEALLDSAQFSAFSGGRAAQIHREAGAAFSLFAGRIVGRNLELVADRLIVQAWRSLSWPEGIYSIARFELLQQGSATRLIFDHTGFPVEDADSLESGWTQNYWKPLHKYLLG
jgi:activator of HSP90 ATPase